MRSPYGRALNMLGMGRPMAAGAAWGVCLICLALAALWLQLLYGALSEYAWHGPPCGGGRSRGRVRSKFGVGHPMVAAAPWGLCLVCLAWAALWLCPLYGACAQYAWHGPHCGCSCSTGHVLTTFGRRHPMAAAALWGMCLICLAWAALRLRALYEACA